MNFEDFLTSDENYENICDYAEFVQSCENENEKQEEYDELS